MEIANQIRGYRFLLGVLSHQRQDPHCGKCSAYANTLKAVRERIANVSSEPASSVGGIPADLKNMLTAAQDGIASLSAPNEPVGQKKAGNCRLPQGVCFLKASFALFQQV